MTAPRAPVPLLRPGVHAATGLVALSLGVLPFPLAVAGAALGVVVGWVVLPKMAALERRLRRPGEPFLGGLRTYPVAVLLLVVCLPAAEAAAAWGVLAFGDSAAAIVGSRVPSPSLFGHAKATWAGTAAHAVAGTIAAFALGAAVVALGSLTGVEVGDAPGVARCAAAAGVAALLDLVHVPPDDNLPCAVGAGAALRLLRGVM